MFTNPDGTLTPLGQRFERVLDPENQKQLADGMTAYFASVQRSAQQFADAAPATFAKMREDSEALGRQMGDYLASLRRP